MPSPMSPCRLCTEWYSPATSAERYVEITLVVGNRHTPPSFVAPSLLETTVQSLGALTWKVNVPLMSGWSKHANTRWASLLSNRRCTHEPASSDSSKRRSPDASGMDFP